MKNLFAKIAKEHKRIVAHIKKQSGFKSQEPQDEKDFDHIMSLRKKREL